jgi:hypothetical protein
MDTQAATPPLVLVVELFVHPGREFDFRRLEAAAARLMRRYGGRIAHVIRPTQAPRQPPPDEIHVVTFPSAERFDAYRGDPELLGLAGLRQATIVRTEVTAGVALPGDGAEAAE